MARLTPEQWQQIRETWESDDDLTFEQLSKSFPISRQAISKKANHQLWRKRSGKSVKSAQQRNKNDKVAQQHHKIAIDALTEIITDKETPKNLVIAACAELLRA